MPIQLAQCRFRGLAISNAEISLYFSNEIIMRKRFYQTALGNGYGLKLPKCQLQFAREKNYRVTYYNFRHIFVPRSGPEPAAVQPRKYLTRLSATAGCAWSYPPPSANSDDRFPRKNFVPRFFPRKNLVHRRCYIGQKGRNVYAGRVHHWCCPAQGLLLSAAADRSHRRVEPRNETATTLTKSTGPARHDKQPPPK